MGGEPGTRSAKTKTSAGSGGPATTDEQAALTSSQDGAQAAPDPETLRRAREIAARLAMPRPRTDRTARRGRGEVASVPYRGGSDDIDLDRTLEQLTEHPVPEDEDIVVRERVTTTRSVVLLVDVSGSMRGERVRTAAATVGALAAELARDNLAVIAFWSDAAVLSHLGQHVAPAAARRVDAADTRTRAHQPGVPAPGGAAGVVPRAGTGCAGRAAVGLRAQRRPGPAADGRPAAQARRPARHDG